MDDTLESTLEQNTYDCYAEAYAAMIAESARADFSFYHHVVAPQVFAYLGDVAGRTVLDAGCGEGTLARLLAERGAQVTAIDISPRLVELARAQDPLGHVTYAVRDLSQGLPHVDPFDLVVSNLVLNDVYDYRGYLATLGAVTKAGGRLVISMNNPYSAVLREKAASYFDSGSATLYQGLSKAGVRVYYFHRTMEDYVRAFRSAGFLARSLADIRVTPEMPLPASPTLDLQYRFPFIMVLELVKV
jgi:2-polyprenyl-3-methyl-5-hydroxy-6-metoxy-1,4-benzoquinol methylase